MIDKLLKGSYKCIISQLNPAVYKLNIPKIGVTGRMLGVTEAAPCPRTDQPRLYQVASLRRDSYRSASCLRLLRSLFQERKATLTREFKGGQRVGPAATVNATIFFSYIVCGERSPDSLSDPPQQIEWHVGWHRSAAHASSNGDFDTNRRLTWNTAARHRHNAHYGAVPRANG